MEVMETPGPSEEKKPVSTTVKSAKKGASTQPKKRRTVTRKKKEKVDGDGEYAVEKIVDKRTVDGKLEYFIKWQGWPTDANTWEPIEHLQNCLLLIQAYEAKLEASKKKPGKRGRSGSNSSTTVIDVSKNGGATYGDGASKDDVMDMDFSDSDDGGISGFDYDIEDQEFPLSECPENREVAKIHAVAVVDGYLTFLVQWKTEDCVDGKLPPISDKNTSMVRAACMNHTFPQEVIAFYEPRIRFNLSMDPAELEAKKAALAILRAKERRNELMLKRLQAGSGNEEDDNDPAVQAIEKEQKAHDKFNPMDSDLNSSSSEEDIFLGSDNDDQA